MLITVVKFGGYGGMMMVVASMEAMRVSYGASAGVWLCLVMVLDLVLSLSNSFFSSHKFIMLNDYANRE